MCLAQGPQRSDAGEAEKTVLNFRSPPLILRDLWVSPVINRLSFGRWETDFFYNRNLKSKGNSFKSKNFWINSMCEYLGRNGYLSERHLDHNRILSQQSASVRDERIRTYICAFNIVPNRES